MPEQEESARAGVVVQARVCFATVFLGFTLELVCTFCFISLLQNWLETSSGTLSGVRKPMHSSALIPSGLEGIGNVGVPQWTQHSRRHVRVHLKMVAPQRLGLNGTFRARPHIDVGKAQGGEPGYIIRMNLVSEGLEPLQAGPQITGVPQHHGVDPGSRAGTGQADCDFEF